MKKIFIEVSPGFYKTKLFNEISKQIDIDVVYTNTYDKSTRNKDFLKGSRLFNYFELNGTKWKQCLKIVQILRKGNYDEVIVGGYNSIISYFTALVSKKKKNAILLESTFRETKQTKIRSFLKKLFFKRMNRVYVCGSPHEKLARMFGFKGECRYWYSVGLINVIAQPPFEKREQVKDFLFVGRLIKEKNLLWLIDRFNNHQELNLTIIGFGPLEEELHKAIKGSNIKMIGAVDNQKLPEFYQKADVFILPSISETWGLVVEEALNNGTPVIASDMVGAADDLLLDGKNGSIFESNNVDSFENCIKEMCDISNYNNKRENISRINFDEREREIINAFLS